VYCWAKLSSFYISIMAEDLCLLCRFFSSTRFLPGLTIWATQSMSYKDQEPPYTLWPHRFNRCFFFLFSFLCVPFYSSFQFSVLFLICFVKVLRLLSTFASVSWLVILVWPFSSGIVVSYTMVSLADFRFVFAPLLGVSHTITLSSCVHLVCQA
jgi:hypothetical protein